MVSFQISSSDIARAQKAFDKLGKDIRPAIKNALNRTGRFARKALVGGAKSIYAFKPGIRIGDVRMKTAQAGDLSVYLSNTTRPRTLRQFKTRETKAGVKASVLRKGSPRLLRRSPGGAAWMGHGGNVAGLVTQREGADRYPLRIPHGPSIAKMLEMIYTGKKGGGRAQPVIQNQLHTEIEAEIAKLTAQS